MEMAWEMEEVRFAGMSVRIKVLDRKKKNILEKGYWKQMLSFDFFGW